MQPTNPRPPWLPALLSLAFAGLGQAYNGRPFKVCVFLLAQPVLSLVFTRWAMTGVLQPLNVLLPVPALLAVQLLAAVDAWRDAARLRSLPASRYGGWRGCAAVVLAGNCVLYPARFTFFLGSWAKTFSVPGKSMEPALVPGDRVLVDKAAYGLRLPFSGRRVTQGRPPARGDLVAFSVEVNRKRRTYVKRVIGLPRERLELRRGTVYVDGGELAEPYLTSKGSPGGPKSDWPAQVVPDGALFVLGDDSFDSRYHGFVPLDDVLGVVRLVYFSWDARAGRLRGERTGLALK